MENVYLYNTIALLLFVFILWSGTVAVASLILARCFPALANWDKYWLGAYILCFSVFFSSTWIELDIPYFYQLKEVFTVSDPHQLIHAKTQDYVPNQTIQSPWGVPVFLSLCLASAIFALFRFVVNLFRVRSLLRTSQVLKVELNSEQTREVKTRQIRLRCHEHIPPFSFTFWHSYVVVPKAFMTLSMTDKRILLEHELQHIRRGDTRTIVLMRFMSILFWINPFIHLFEKRYIQAMEKSCDLDVLQALQIDGKTYANAMINHLKACNKAQKSRLIAYFSTPITAHSEMMSRIKHVMSMPVYHAGIRRWSLGVIFAVTFVSGILVKSAVFVPVANTFSSGLMPIAGGVVQFGFSEKDGAAHYGLDIRAPHGSRVVASFAGKVVVAGADSLDESLGATVVIEHKDNSTSLYANLDKLNVKVGQVVYAGQPIGTLADTLGVTGTGGILPHLHFEIIKGRQHIDPLPLLNVTTTDLD